jgi:hypothetical protein
LTDEAAARPAGPVSAGPVSAGPVSAGPAAAGPVSARPGPAGAAPSRPGRRPWWVWAVPFAAIFGVVLARNWFLFSTRLYEGGDSAANSILIEQAIRFRLLVGNYSREGFHHPGPAYLYVQALGEWLAHSLLHVVPTAWNGQLLAVFAQDAAFAALATGVCYGWARSLRGAAACVAVLLAFAAVHPEILVSNWMPHLYVLTFFVFLLAAASVAAGRAADLWVMALSGWFLIHGHAAFLLFVPAIAIGVLVAAAWPARRALRASAGRCFRGYRSAWLPALVISVLFAAPIAINLALHWPGDFGKYVGYSRSGQAGGHSPAQAVRFALWFWWPHRLAWVVPLVLYAAAATVTFRAARGPLRRFLAAVLGSTVAASLVFGGYALAGVDYLTEYYIGYFYWAVPFLLVLVVALGLAQALRWPGWDRLAVAGAAAALAAFAFLPGLHAVLDDNDPALPHAVATLAARAPGRVIVIYIAFNAAWSDTAGFLVQAERAHVRACVDQPSYEFIVTSQFICTASQRAAGQRYLFVSPAPPRGTPAVLHFASTTVIPPIGLHT